MLSESIRKRSAELADEMVSIRRKIHANPELSFQEHQTAAYIGRILDEWGISHESVAGTGVTGVLKGKPGGKYLMLRADIDALPVTEKNACDYHSVRPGIMHACGHDVHTACLLGAIKIVSGLTAGFSGTVRFLFQPGEEVLPGGAIRVLESGLLDHPEPDYVLAQHVYPELPSGYFGFRAGPYMASTDEVFIDVIGTGGHAALRKGLVDPVLIASQVVVGLQEAISRKIPADVPVVLAFGKFDAPGTTNVIPPQVKLEGTFRTLDENWRSVAHEEIRSTAKKIAASMGAEAVCRIVDGNPSLANDPALTGQVIGFAREYAGIEKVTDLPQRMTGEDFARYALRFPSVFYRLGTGSRIHTHPVHHPEFDVDETSIAHGMGMMAYLTLRLLSQA